MPRRSLTFWNGCLTRRTGTTSTRNGFAMCCSQRTLKECQTWSRLPFENARRRWSNHRICWWRWSQSSRLPSRSAYHSVVSSISRTFAYSRERQVSVPAQGCLQAQTKVSRDGGGEAGGESPQVGQTEVSVSRKEDEAREGPAWGRDDPIEGHSKLNGETKQARHHRLRWEPSDEEMNDYLAVATRANGHRV